MLAPRRTRPSPNRGPPLSFASLGLKKPILAGVRKAGYTKPTEIQERAIPIVLDGHDLIACGETGSGKTAVFGLPILDALVGGETCLRALILVPTRELCVQVAESLRVYASGTDLHVRTAFGGIDMRIQEAAFARGLDVLVACPGRLIDHLERRNVTLDNVKILVLDEADRMLDMGFLPQIRRILSWCPRDRRTLLFSATMPPEVAGLCEEFMADAKRVQVGRRSQASANIKHDFRKMPQGRKTATLESLLDREPGRVLVFVRSKSGAQELGQRLRYEGWPADSLHGDKSAEARYTALQRFDRGKVRCIVATDVAARGLDIDNVELVVNYDLPHSVEDYVHRVGRTGRAGRSGRAVSFVSPRDDKMYRAIIKHLDAKTDAQADAASREATELSAHRTGGRRSGARSGSRSGSRSESRRDDAPRRGRGPSRDDDKPRGDRPRKRRDGDDRTRDDRPRGDRSRDGETAKKSAPRKRRDDDRPSAKRPRRRSRRDDD